MMSNEEFDRKMEFLLNQQARFDAGMQELREAQKVTDEKFKHMFDGFEEGNKFAVHTRETLDELTILTTEGFKILYEQSRNTDAKIAALVNSQIETAERFRETDAKFRETDTKFRETDAKFRETDAKFRDTDTKFRETDAIVRNIGVKFDRHLKEDHNSG
jgi:hypothetical protein